MSYKRKIEGSIKFNVKNNIYSYYRSLLPDNTWKACDKYQYSLHIQLHSFYTILTDKDVKFIYNDDSSFKYDNDHISKCSTFVKIGSNYDIDLKYFIYKNLINDNFSKDDLLALNNNSNDVLGLITVLKERNENCQSYECFLDNLIGEYWSLSEPQLVFYKGSTSDAIVLHSLPRYCDNAGSQRYAPIMFFGNYEADSNTDIELNFKVEVPATQADNNVKFYIYETVVLCDCAKNDYKIVTTEIKTPSTSWNICQK
jgi:hypothetical protein